MVVSQQLGSEPHSPLFCGPASISHRHLVYKTPGRGLTFQTGPGGEEDELHSALQAETTSVRETSFPGKADPADTLTSSWDQLRHTGPEAAPTGSTLPAPCVLLM